MSSVDAQIPGYVRFAIAGLSGGGASFASHPFDLVKYRMQISGKGGTERTHKTSLHAVYNIATQEGILAIYKGLSASILRQLTLTMTRLGMYSAIVDNFTAADGTPPSLTVQIIAGLLSGGVGAVIGNPADIALVRMASDGAHPPNERYNYKNPFNAIKRIAQEEGLAALWTGWKPAAFRCMVLNLTQIVLYKNTKVLLLKTDYFKDDSALHILCSIWTALASSAATAPIDITKTRQVFGLLPVKYDYFNYNRWILRHLNPMMLMKTIDGKPEYTSMVDVWRKIIKHEGFFSLWKGLTPTFGRILPNNFMIFILLEFFTKYYKKFVLGDTSGSGF